MTQLNWLFGDPAGDKAKVEQWKIVRDQLAAGNKLHNNETTAEMMRDQATINYARRLSSIERKKKVAEGNTFLASEHAARMLAIKGKSGEGGRSTMRGKNVLLGTLAVVKKMEVAERFTKNEAASKAVNAAILNYRHDTGRAIEKAGIGVPARSGYVYTKENNWGKLVTAIATKGQSLQQVGAFGTRTQEAGGGNASMWDAIFNSDDIA
tara:strand:+ start:34 stop:660 length:627 start_codon:yes stop_codon:yes gene_type:complete